MAKPKLALIPAAQGGELFSVLPSSGVGDFDFSRSGSATRINSQGLIEEVGDGVSRLNYPMIDGKVVGCPHHILEPQRTNYVFPSNGFVSWTGGLSMSQNYGISPDGSQNSTKISGQGLIFTSPNRPTSDYVFSVFAKNINEDSSIIQLRIDIPASLSAEFDLSNGTIVSNNTDDAKIEYYGNGWYRCIVIQNNDAIANTVIANGSVEDLSCEIFGAMLEESSYPTSYIPTNGSAVTRSAETANNSGDASTFNDSEGVLMLESSSLSELEVTARYIQVSDGTSTPNGIQLRYYTSTNFFQALYYTNGAYQSVLGYTLPNSSEFNKIAFKYKQNDFALWIDGLELVTDASGLTGASLSNLSFDYNGSAPLYGNVKQLQYYNSALTDSELEQLTSWTSFTDMANGQLYSVE